MFCKTNERIQIRSPSRPKLTDTDDGGGDSSDESFDYAYSDGDPVSEPEKGVGTTPLCRRRPRRFAAHI